MALTGKSRTYSLFNHLIVKGRRFQGPILNISDNIRKLYSKLLSPLFLRFIPGSIFSRLDILGFCQAHSNWNYDNGKQSKEINYSNFDSAMKQQQN